MKKYDVFLSHSSKDKNVVRNIANKLQSDGLSVWFDENEIKPGDNFKEKIQDGIKQSRAMICFMSQTAFSSEWVDFETRAIFHNECKLERERIFEKNDNFCNDERRLIPLRLDDVDLVGDFINLNYVDWRNESERTFQYTRLFNAIADHTNVEFRKAYIRTVETKIYMMNVEFRNITFIWDNEYNQQSFNKLEKEKIELQLDIQVDDLEYISGERFNLNHIFDEKNKSFGECDWRRFQHTFDNVVLIPTKIQDLVLHATGVEWEVKISRSKEYKTIVSGKNV
jgi:hypothetical protein